MSQRTWSERERNEVAALVEIMYFVAQADGEFSIPERRNFLETVQAISEGHLDSTELLEMIENAEVGLRDQGLPKRLESLRAILTDELTRRLAFGLGTKIAMADGAVAPAETAILDAIADAFELSPEDHEEIAHSVRMSQRPGI
jgi:tellurite resistance protein